MRRKKSTRGLTLVELVAVLALFTILTVGVAGLLQPILNIYRESTNLSRGKLIADNVLDLMEEELKYALDCTASGPSASYLSRSYGPMELTVKDGILSASPADGGEGDLGLSKKVYMENTIALNFSQQPGEDFLDGHPRVTVFLTVYNSRGETIYRAERVVTLLNISALPLPEGS